MPNPISERNTTTYGFKSAYATLLRRINKQIRSGAVSERRLARLTGYSQPHVHNVLRGIRGLQPDLADRFMEVLGLTLRDLSPSEEPPSAAGSQIDVRTSPDEN